LPIHLTQVVAKSIDLVAIQKALYEIIQASIPRKKRSVERGNTENQDGLEAKAPSPAGDLMSLTN
jgi:hypothetical protein